MFKSLANVFTNEDGATLVEYGLVLALIAVIAIAALTALGGKIVTLFNGITKAI